MIECLPSIHKALSSNLRTQEGKEKEGEEREGDRGREGRDGREGRGQQSLELENRIQAHLLCGLWHASLSFCPLLCKMETI